MTTEKEIQVLRTIDKFDKIGADGVEELLQKSQEEYGAGLDKVRAKMVVEFLTCKGETNDKTLENMKRWFRLMPIIKRRLDLIDYLETEEISPDYTKWDQLLDMPTNEDETWSGNGRPKNIAYTLDDILMFLDKNSKSEQKV